MNQQAIELNKIITENNPVIYELLSEKGRAAFFPKTGILSQSAEAKGKKINATIGIALEEDGSPMRLKSISENVLLEPSEVFPYAPSFGKPELRKLWKDLILKKNSAIKNEMSLPIVTQALTHALSVLGFLFVNPGDKIILSDKFWGNYRLIFENLSGAKIETFNTFDEDEFDIKSLENKLNESYGKKILLLNFPNNPTGYTPTVEEMEKIVGIIKKRAELGDKFLVICDDAYFGLVYKEGVCKESIFSYLTNLHKNVLAVKVDGATKEDYVWGLRVGFITYANQGISKDVCATLEAKTAGTIRGNISNASNLSQGLMIKALGAENYQKEKEEKFQILKSRYDVVQEVLKNPDFSTYFKPLPFNSGYFMCLELNAHLRAEEVRKILLEKYDTGVISTGNFLRIAYSSVKKEDIPNLFKNIFNACILCQK
ncbi:MAG: aminotransferase class I/II-fold pyridoxal phosphate-dependent enzyme [Patescibacteria group bacterium]|nr:aminotransferase class I/II-fold pyridoxal phosphate-dependent enzyme [Patescibacteria group bacterium]